MARNGRRRPPRPRIEILSATSSDSEAAAIVAALEQFLVDTTPPQAAGPATSPWQSAALREAVAARQLPARTWGTAASWRAG
jgi:hypothetical protein